MIWPGGRLKEDELEIMGGKDEKQGESKKAREG